MKLKSKLFVGVIALAMVLGVAAPASAATVEELTAQINALLAQIAQLQAQIGGTTTGASTTFTQDLTIGSTGSEVSALQSFLVSKGHLTMPAGVAMGYFGPLTQSALAKYQAAAGISPAAGYFGPITRANINALGGGTTTGGTTTGSTGITTPGVEGTLSVTVNNSGLASTLYEGDSMASILGFNIEAKNSDIAVQRIKLHLGTNTAIYNKIYSKVYVTEGGNVLASSDLNSSTVVKDGSDYYITIAGFNLVVPKGVKKQIIIKADAHSAFDSTDISTFNGNTVGTVALAANGVRGVDGAGIDQYAGGSTNGAVATKDLQLAATLTDSAAVKVSLNGSSPDASSLVASEGAADDELDRATVLVFDAKAEKDNITITDLNVITSGGSTTYFPTYYLYDGSTEIGNVSATATAHVYFADLDIPVSKDSTKTLTIKVDVRSAPSSPTTLTPSVTATSVLFENSVGDSFSSTGSATGRAISFSKAGAQITLVSKSITTSGVAQTASNPLSTSTLTATFNVKIKAVGADVYLGTTASDTPAFRAASSFKLYKNGVLATYNMSTSTSYTIPSTCVTSGTYSCLLSDGNEVTVPVTFQIPGRYGSASAIDSALYSVGLEAVYWNGTVGSATFMAGLSDWRTADVSFP